MIIDKFLHSFNNLQGITLFVHCINMPIANAHSINYKGENHLKSRSILYFHLCLSWKNPSNSSFNSLALTCTNETKWNERNEVAKQSNDFTNFSSVTFAWTATALPAGWWTHMARVIDEKSFNLLLFDQFSWFDTLFIIEGLYLSLRNLYEYYCLIRYFFHSFVFF